MVIQVTKITSVYFCHLFLISSVSVLYCAQAHRKCSLDVSHFLEEISSLSHSISFFYFCAFVYLRRLSYCSSLFSGTMHSVRYIFPFLLCLSLLSSGICKPFRLSFCPLAFLFLWDGFDPCSVQCYEPLSVDLQAFCLPDLIP